MKDSNAISNTISILALLVSLFVGYRQFFTLDHYTVIFAYHSEVGIDSGRLGAGPKLLIGFSVVNSGNRPIVISKSSVSYYYPSIDNFKGSCRIGGGGITVPWIENFNGEKLTTAVPTGVTGGSTAIFLTRFEPIGYRFDTNQDSELQVCLNVEAVDSRGEVYSGSIHIGRIYPKGEHILIEQASNQRVPFTLVPRSIF